MRKSGLYRLRRAAVLGGLTAAYYAAGRYGLSLAFLNSSASPVWPPTGLALAAMLLLGRWVWPSILAGAFLVNLTTSGDWQAASMIACGNAIEALAGYWMAERFCGGRRTFDAIPDIFRFALTAGTGASAIAASLGTAALLLRHLAVPAEAGRVWFTWWMGDTISAWMLTPFLVLLGRVRMVRVERMRALEGAALIAGLFELIPYLGPILSAVPVALVAASKGPETLLLGLAVMLVVHWVEAAIVAPLAAKRMVSLPPAVSVFGVIAGGMLFGPVGLVFASPLLVVVMVLVKRLWVEEALHTPTHVPGRDPEPG